MKRSIILIGLSMLLAACTYSPSQPETPLASSSELAPSSVDGYYELLPKVYLAETIDRQLQVTVHQYGATNGDSEEITEQFTSWLGSGFEEQVVVEDKVEHRKLIKGDTTAEAFVNKLGAWIHYGNPQATSLREVYSNFLLDSMDQHVSISQFNDSLSFESEEALKGVKEFIGKFQFGFSDFDYVVASVSKASFQQYLPYMQETLLKGTENISRYEAALADAYFITVHPKIDGYRIIDSATSLGSLEQLNETIGTEFVFVVTAEGIQYLDISGLFLATAPVAEPIEITSDKILAAIKSKYDETLLEQPVYIEEIQVAYAPIPLNQVEGNLYNERQYQPIVVVTVKEQDQLQKFYLNPLTWKEV